MYNNTGAARDLVHFLEDEWIATFLTTIYKYYKHINIIRLSVLIKVFSQSSSIEKLYYISAAFTIMQSNTYTPTLKGKKR